MSLPSIELEQSKTITIDLQGHTVSATGADAFSVEAGKLIVIESVGGGKINHTGTDDLVWLQSDGTLQLDAGSYSFATKYGIVYGDGTLTINGGSYEFAAAYEEDMQGYVSPGKTVTINGVSFTKH